MNNAFLSLVQTLIKIKIFHLYEFASFINFLEIILWYIVKMFSGFLASSRLFRSHILRSIHHRIYEVVDC